MTMRTARKIVESAGMAVSDDGVAFTVCGGQLVNGDAAPPHIAAMNGWTVEDVARASTGAISRTVLLSATPTTAAEIDSTSETSKPGKSGGSPFTTCSRPQSRALIPET